VGNNKHIFIENPKYLEIWGYILSYT